MFHETNNFGYLIKILSQICAKLSFHWLKITEQTRSKIAESINFDSCKHSKNSCWLYKNIISH